MNRHFPTINKHLQNNYYLPIRDPVWGHIYLSDPFKKIIQTREFQQLSRIKQLGPSHLLYPGATHTRLSHSLGVFHIALKLIQHFIQRDKNIPVTPEGTRAFLAAALLHDLGHFPFTHSLKELPLKGHEQLTSEIILSTGISAILKDDLGIDPGICASIIDESRETADEEIHFFRKILNGPIDPDKLDYLNRDAYFCGIPYGFQDVEYILSVLEPHPQYGFVIERDSVAVIEGLLFSKYLMYRAVYWHQTVRTATGMIKKALFTALQDNEIQADDLYNMDDDSFYTKFANSSNPRLSLITAVYNRELFSTIATIDFNESLPSHRILENLEDRRRIESSIRIKFEDALGIGMADSDIMIDIPENISFEMDIMVRDNEEIESYRHAPSVFTADVIQQFIRSLRKIRITVSDRVAKKVHTFSPEQRQEFLALSGL